MVLGCIKIDGGKKLVKVAGSLNSKNYISLLWSNLLDYEDGEFFQYDNATYHISHAAKRFLVDEDVKHLKDWPEQCPNLNIIEPL